MPHHSISSSVALVLHFNAAYCRSFHMPWHKCHLTFHLGHYSSRSCTVVPCGAPYTLRRSHSMSHTPWPLHNPSQLGLSHLLPGALQREQGNPVCRAQCTSMHAEFKNKFDASIPLPFSISASFAVFYAVGVPWLPAWIPPQSFDFTQTTMYDHFDPRHCHDTTLSLRGMD